MGNAGLDDAQAGIKISRRNINNLRYTDDTTLIAESEELKSLLMKVKEESEKAGLKVNIWKTKIRVSGPISSVQFSSVTQSCLTLSNPMGCSLPGSSIHGIFQARVLEWGTIAFSATYLGLLIFLPAILISACASSSPAFHMMYCAHKLNKQGDNIQP